MSNQALSKRIYKPVKSSVLILLSFSLVSFIFLSAFISNNKVKASGGAPTSPPVTWCETGLPTSPYNYSGSATSFTTYTSGTTGLPTFGTLGSDFPNDTQGYIVPDGAISSTTNLDQNYGIAPNTVYWFASGTHTFSGEFDQIQPAYGDVFVGAPGAILDGSGSAQSAFASNTFLSQSTTVASSSNNTDVSTYTGSGVVNVASTTSFPTSGYAVIATSAGDDALIEYTGTTSSTLTGAKTLDGSGTISTGVSVSVGDSPVTINYLTIQNFTAAVGENVVNHNDSAYWTVEDDTIQGTTDGAAVGGGNDNTIENNCFTNNAEYGGNLGGANITLSDNDISYNSLNSQYFPSDIPCGGCSGGVKFWDSLNSTVEDNYIHDNGGVGLWFDTNNAGALIEGNYISNSFSNGIIYEISYNALITDNTLIGNGYSYSQSAAGNVVGEALYISNSGGDSNVASNYSGTFTVSDNVFTDNWDGIVVYQNSDRICSNNYTSDCTLDDPGVYTNTSCASSGGGGDNTASTPTSGPPTPSPSTNPYDYYDYCQWKSNNITIENNTINFNAAAIANATVASDWSSYVTLSNCTTSNYLNTTNAPPSGNEYYCGYNGMYGFTGSHPPQGGTWIVENALMSTTGHNLNSNGEAADNNLWENNSYVGPQNFQGYSQGSGTENGYQAQTDFTNWASNWSQDSGSSLNPLAVNINNLNSNQEVYGPNQGVDAYEASLGGNTITSKLAVNSTDTQTLTSAPYDFTLDTLNYSDGSYSIQVQSTDNQSNSNNDTVTVNVSNGDLNLNGDVNISDLAIMANHWGAVSGATYQQGSILENGAVNISDLAILANNWGWSD